MKRLLPLSLGLAVTALASLAAPSLAHAQGPPPSLFFDLDDVPAIKERVNSTDWLRDAFAYSVLEADFFLKTELEPYSLTSARDPETGINGNGIGTAGRAVQHRLATLGFVGHVTGEQKYLDQGKALLLAVVRQTEPDSHKHWITHLQSGDIAQGLAYGYDFFGHLLSAEEDAEVVDYLQRLGHFLVHQDTTWSKPAPGVTSCNHNAVHHGGLGLLAMALNDHDDWLDKARKRVRAYFELYIDEDGYATEGHDYYGYGMSGAMPFSHAVQRKTGEVLWDTQPNFFLGPDQIVWKLMPFEGRMLAMNDNPDQHVEPSGVLPALMSQNGVQLWAWLESLPTTRSGLRRTNGQLTKGHASLLKFLVGDRPTEPVSATEAGLALGHRFESGRVFLRDGWESDNAAHVSMTSGYDFHRGHNHQDENAVTFAAFGEDFLTDPGYLPIHSEQHTVLTVNGVGMVVGSEGRIAEYREDEHGALVLGQAENAYDFNRALVGFANRLTYFVRGPHPYLVWRDDMGLEDDVVGEYKAHFAIHLKNELSQEGKNVRIDGARGNASCLLKVFSEGEPIDVVVDDLENETFVRHGKDQPYLNHLRRASATVQKRNPRFLSIALPFRSEAELPQVDVEWNEATDEITCVLVFPDGQTDTLVFANDDVRFHRN